VKVQCKKVYLKERDNGDSEMVNMKNTYKSGVKPHICFIAHYYIPDEASTGQILAEIAEELLKEFKVSVICTIPSYTGIISPKYRNKKYYTEKINGVDVIRVRVPEFTKSNKVSRIKNIFAYSIRAMIATGKIKNVDYILAVSQPPIIGGLLGVWGKWAKKAKFIYQIQDFNPEQACAINYTKSKLIIGIMMWIDKFSCKRADLVITVGRDLVETLKKRFNGKKCPNVALINNWIDENEIHPLNPENEKVIAFKKMYGIEDKFIFMYSGNIGLYYDLEELLKVIKKFKPGTKSSDGREVFFVFVGAGSVLDKLMIYAKTRKMTNVVFIPYQNKRDLNYSLNAGDVHWCVNAKGIKGVSCPSKYYGLAACAKPILGVMEEGAEIRCLIEETDGGLVSEPGDYATVEKNIRWFIDSNGDK